MNRPLTHTESRSGRGGLPRPSLLCIDEFVARVRPWPGEPGTAQLVITTQTIPPLEVIERWIVELGEAGFLKVRTGALSPAVAAAFLQSGFTVRQHLALLHHDLAGVRARVVPCESLMMRRGRTADLPTTAHLDGRAFGPMWAMDAAGIADARTATPQHRFRLADDESAVVGFAVSGRAGRQAFLQRLAVDPAHQGRGIGKALTLDALRWARRHRCTSMFVNTHSDNRTALALYVSLGFSESPQGLVVLERSLS